MRYFALLFVLIAALTGCKKKVSGPEDVKDDFNRSALLSDLSLLIESSHIEYNEQISELQESVVAFTANPSEENLTMVRVNWSGALIKWQAVAPYEFGAAANIAMEASTNIFPVDVDIIETNLDNGSYNLSTAANLKAIGLQALDYLLHGIADSDSEIVALYVEGPKAEQRRVYLLDIVSKLKDMSIEVMNNWLNGAEARAQFVANDGTDQGSSMGLFLNAFNRSYEKTTRTHKLGIPSGAMTFSMTPNPNTVEAFYEKDKSIEYLLASVDAMEKIYLGGSEEKVGLNDYINFLEARNGDVSLDAAIRNSIQDVRIKISNIQGDLADAVVHDQQATLDAFASMQNLVVLWKVDMMSTLGILITYQDTDGD